MNLMTRIFLRPVEPKKKIKIIKDKNFLLLFLCVFGLPIYWANLGSSLFASLLWIVFMWGLLINARYEHGLIERRTKN